MSGNPREALSRLSFQLLKKRGQIRASLGLITGQKWPRENPTQLRSVKRSPGACCCQRTMWGPPLGGTPLGRAPGSLWALMGAPLGLDLQGRMRPLATTCPRRCFDGSQLRRILTRPLLSSEKAQGCPDLASFFQELK